MGYQGQCATGLQVSLTHSLHKFGVTPLDTLTRAGVTLCLLCCLRVAICFRLRTGVQLPHLKLHTTFCRTGFQAIEANIGETSTQRVREPCMPKRGRRQAQRTIYRCHVHQLSVNKKNHLIDSDCAQVYAVWENVCSRSLEWNFLVWVAHLELKDSSKTVCYHRLSAAERSAGKKN